MGENDEIGATNENGNDINRERRGVVEVKETESGHYEYSDSNAKNSLVAKLFGKSLFGWTPARVRRGSEPPEMVVLKPGMLTHRVLTDALTFSWLTYLDDDPEADVNYSNQYQTEYTNIGLLSALVFTVWVSFQTQSLNFSTDYNNNQIQQIQIAYSVIWTLASASVLFSTICSIMILLAINETSCPTESQHFMKTFDEATFGVGSLIPLILLYTSVIEGAFGTMLWYFINYQSYVIALVVFFTLGFLTQVFVFFSLEITASLYIARHTNTAIDQLPETKLNIEELEELFKMYVSSVNGDDNIETEDQFINFIRVKAGKKGYKCKLTTLTDRVARKFFNKKFDSITDQFIDKMEKDLINGSSNRSNNTKDDTKKDDSKNMINKSIKQGTGGTDSGEEIDIKSPRNLKSRNVSNRSDIAFGQLVPKTPRSELQANSDYVESYGNYGGNINRGGNGNRIVPIDTIVLHGPAMSNNYSNVDSN